MSFNILYPEDGDPTVNLYSIAVYIDSFAEKLGLGALEVDSSKLSSVARALSQPSFPHVDGVAKASPFKKAANFFVWFAALKPIVRELPVSLIGDKLASIPNHQNVIFPYHMAIDCLHGAHIYKGAEEVILKNRIVVSKHFFIDLVEAFSAAVPTSHFQIASLLFEQLAYKANPTASYQERV